MNVACAVADCENPVIGQCPGYKGPCGRYYCRNHSSEGLCQACATHKTNEEEAERIYQDYLATAKHLNSDNNIVGLVLTVFVLIAAVITWLSSGSAEIGFFTLFVAAILGALLAAAARRERLAKAAEGRPGFEEFYAEFRKAKTKDALMTGLGVAGAITLGVVGAAIAESDRAQRVRDIEEGVRRGMR
jgi:uncharacterized membrane protein YeaQ/YmgE (transglycosylase-associated protein family)